MDERDIVTRTVRPNPRVVLTKNIQSFANGRSCVNFVENAMWEVPVLSAALEVQLPT